MTSDYTPTTERVRQRWLEAYEYERDMPGKIRVRYPDEVLAQFDCWLAEHDRQVAERAWDEGFDAGRDDLGAAAVAIEHGEDENPYRKNGRSE